MYSSFCGPVSAVSGRREVKGSAKSSFRRDLPFPRTGCNLNCSSDYNKVSALCKTHPMQTDFPLPPDLPRPVDDGAARHLLGTPMPSINLQSTAGKIVNLSELSAPRTVLFCYPMTGVPGQPLPEGWDLIPGARGCTPQACSFRDRFSDFSQLHADVFGLSTQSTSYQRELATRVHLPFELLSDSEFQLCDALRLPTFEVQGMRLIKRLTFIIAGGLIQHVFYPVFPPDESTLEVLEWLKKNP